MGQNVYHAGRESVRQKKRVAVWQAEQQAHIRKKSNKQLAREAQARRERFAKEEQCYRLGKLLHFPRETIRVSIERNGVNETKARLVEQWAARKREASKTPQRAVGQRECYKLARKLRVPESIVRDRIKENGNAATHAWLLRAWREFTKAKAK